MEKQNDQLQICDELDNTFKTFVFEAENSPQNASLLLTKATTIKRKCKENIEDVKSLEGVFKLLEQKRKVEVVYNWNCIHIDSFMSCYFNCYNRLMSRLPRQRRMPLFAFLLHFVASSSKVCSTLVYWKFQWMYCSHYKVNNTL